MYKVSNKLHKSISKEFMLIFAYSFYLYDNIDYSMDYKDFKDFN